MDRKQWIPAESQFISRRILVTKPELTGRRLGDLQLRRLHGINVTRVNRAGLELVATQGLQLQVGDRVTVVGSELAVDKVSAILGNSMKRLNEPNHLCRDCIGNRLGKYTVFSSGNSAADQAGIGRRAVDCGDPDQPFRLSLPTCDLYDAKRQPDGARDRDHDVPRLRRTECGRRIYRYDRE